VCVGGRGIIVPNYMAIVGNINFYYIDRCELWGFIREINSVITYFIEITPNLHV
jgi:hypothetical protein